MVSDKPGGLSVCSQPLLRKLAAQLKSPFGDSCCLLVTADVSSLFPNIDSKKAIIALDPLHREGKVAQTPLLVQLTRLILENNNEFSSDIYHQTFGIAMGTCFAVTAANAFMYYHERDIIEF